MSEQKPTMTPLTPPERLRGAGSLAEAANEIDRVIAELNDRSSPCTCCSRVVYEDWTERQMRVELIAVAAKLRRFSHDLYEKRMYEHKSKALAES